MVYTLFLLKNFADIAVFRISLIYASRNPPRRNLRIANTELAYRLLLLLAMISSTYYLLHCYLLEAMDYTRSLPVWKHLVSVPVLFFIVHHFDIGGVPAQLFLVRHPSTAFSVMDWAMRTCAVHYVTLRALSGLTQNYAIKEQCQTTRLLTSVQTSQTVTLQCNLDQLKRIRHDYHHHLITLRELLEEERIDQTLECINEYLGNFETFSMVQYYSNVSSNTLLNYYIKLAQDQGIDAETSTSLPPPLSVPEIDFCTIFGDLLSNTVEFCMRQTCGPTSTAVNIGWADKFMTVLSIHNTYTHVICLKDGRFMFSKRDNLDTGMSLVRYLVGRYHGIPKFTCEEGIFETSLLLNLLVK